MTTQENTTPAFNHEDAKAVITLIDVAARRGAILGEEMGDVAAMRRRFVQFFEILSPKIDKSKSDS